MSQALLFKWLHFTAEVILYAVRWYLRYALSYRDVEELMRGRGMPVDHTTVFAGFNATCRSRRNGAGCC
jgi:IS6 family transposase